LIAAYVEAKCVALGTDGFGRSDTRGALRSFFEVDRRHILIAALASLSNRGQIPRDTVADAIRRFGIDTAAAAPWTI
jgi:pyruvate dehydrogenase E1 component